MPGLHAAGNKHSRMSTNGPVTLQMASLALIPTHRTEVISWTHVSEFWSILRQIWTADGTQYEALSNTQDWGRSPADPREIGYDGEIFTIQADGKLAGLTGWFSYPDRCPVIPAENGPK